MDLVLDSISWVLVLTGTVFMFVGGLGIIRMPDFFTRQHAAGITDTMAAYLILIALMFQLPFGIDTMKLFFILGFLFLTSPTSSHALAQAAISTGMRPMGTDLREPDLTPAPGMPNLKSKEGAPSNR